MPRKNQKFRRRRQQKKKVEPLPPLEFPVGSAEYCIRKNAEQESLKLQKIIENKDGGL
jgi:hypothetical protein